MIRCGRCGQQFFSDDGLTMFRSLLGVKVYICDVCLNSASNVQTGDENES